MKLAGWGNYPRAEVKLLTARGDAEIAQHLVTEKSLIARGNGRAYGDAALNPSATLSLLRHDRILAFDEATGILTCEAGVMLADILTLFTPRGWFPPVTPGTKFVTIGGMVAADVHGKNHHLHGSFANHITQLTLQLADGAIITCSPTENAELFFVTCGGMGLTGLITEVSFRLIPVETAYIRQQTIRTANLAETMAAFEQSQRATYSVAWIDCLARGDNLGRSVLYLGEHAAKSNVAFFGDVLQPKPRKNRSIPFNFPSFTLNRFSIAAFNALYYTRAKPGASLVDYESFFYPLDGVRDWNRIYGKRGFVQYQCVLPKEASAKGIAALLETIAAAGLGSFLAVLKLLGPGNRYLSFPMPGYTLALDFPICNKLFPLLAKLDAIVATHGGRIYLAKDARMGPAMLQHYPERDAFSALIRQYDPSRKFSSLQSERLGL